MQKGIIQNDKYLRKAILEDQEFVIVCEDEKDCNSKRTSLYNARRTFSEAEQELCRIQKLQIDGKWVVRISRNKPEVYQVVDGILVPVVDPLKEDSKTMLEERKEKD
jgi:predicted RNase H-like HicB family nuclease